MIIIGYQGIGKSTLAGETNKYIDLESSNFNDFVTGKKIEDWHIPYCKIAEDLSRQGYIVFTSCHKEVQEWLQDSEELVALCYPSLKLKEEWIRRLIDRYERTKLEKDFNALTTAIKYYSEHIEALERNNFFKHRIVLNDINYTLQNEIDCCIWNVINE